MKTLSLGLAATLHGVRRLALVLGFIFLERRIGEGAAGYFFVVLALVLPFVAIGWLGWQHFRHRKQK